MMVRIQVAILSRTSRGTRIYHAQNTPFPSLEENTKLPGSLRKVRPGQRRNPNPYLTPDFRQHDFSPGATAAPSSYSFETPRPARQAAAVSPPVHRIPAKNKSQSLLSWERFWKLLTYGL